MVLYIAAVLRGCKRDAARRGAGAAYRVPVYIQHDISAWTMAEALFVPHAGRAM